MKTKIDLNEAEREQIKQLTIEYQSDLAEIHSLFRRNKQNIEEHYRTARQLIRQSDRQTKQEEEKAVIEERKREKLLAKIERESRSREIAITQRVSKKQADTMSIEDQRAAAVDRFMDGDITS